MDTTQPVTRRRILVGVDGSEASRTALLTATALGRQQHALVEALYAYEVPPAYATYATVAPDE